MLRRVGALVGLTLVFLTGPASRAEDANRECDNDQDITVVVDFQALGGGVNVRCAPQPVNNGFDALRRANIAYDQYQGFVCRIAGRPDNEPCNRYPPADAYWVYWYAPRGGEWKYSSYGASARKPPPGSAEGWSFFLKSGDGDKPAPPRYPVPSPLTPATTQPTTGPAPTTPSTPGAPGPATTDRVRSSPPPAPATPHTPASTTTEVAIAPPVEDLAGGAAATTSTVKLGTVDLSVDHGDGGTSTGFIASAAAVVGLAAAAFFFLRLRGR